MITLTLCTQIVTHLSENCFNGNLDIAEIVQEYNECITAHHIVYNISKNINSKLTRDFHSFFTFFTHSIPSLSKYNLSKISDLRRVSLYINENRDDFDLEPTFLGMSISTASIFCVFATNPTPSDIDPISLETIEKDDLFKTYENQSFSLSNLIEFHNTRSYRGTQGELNGNKFIVNPLTNNFFSHEETFSFFLKAIRSNKPVDGLHKTRIVPLNERIPITGYSSLHEEYTNLKHLHASGKI